MRGQYHAERLAEGGAQRRAGRAQGQRPHEQYVQPDIGRTGRRNEVHGAFGVAHAPEDGADDVVGNDEGQARKADAQVGLGAGLGCLRGGHEADDALGEGQHGQGEHGGGAHKQGDGVADVAVGLGPVLCAHGLADHHGGAHGQAHDHHREHVHHLAADGNGGGAVNLAIAADEKQVGHAVKGLQEVREQVRQRETENVFEHAAAGEVVLHGDSFRGFMWGYYVSMYL